MTLPSRPVELSETSPPPENPLLNLAFNLVIPILILEKAAVHLGEQGPLKALLLALCFPVAYGIYDWIRRKKANWLSGFGLLSVLITGGLALSKAEGIWFAVSEASLPLILGLGIMASAFTRKPFISTFLLNGGVMDLDRIHQRLEEFGRQEEFKKLLKHSTLLFSLSFFISAFLNFVLALKIFKPLKEGLSEELKTQALNEQLADMRYWSIFVIMIPMFIFGLFVMWHLLRGLYKTTGLKIDEIVKTPDNAKS